MKHESEPIAEPCTLPARWRQRAAELRAVAAEGQARAFELAATELDAALVYSGEELLSAGRAARECGYSEEHIRRMLRQRPELNRGRNGKPLIRRVDLPKKPRAIAGSIGEAYDPAADAQSLMGRQGAK